MSLPVMTPEQRAGALEKAAAVRRARAAAKAELGKGTVTLAQVLSDEDSPLWRAKVRQVLCALPRVGPVTADKVLAEVGIAANRKVGGLGPNQRAALAERFAA